MNPLLSVFHSGTKISLEYCDVDNESLIFPPHFQPEYMSPLLMRLPSHIMGRTFALWLRSSSQRLFKHSSGIRFHFGFAELVRCPCCSTQGAVLVLLQHNSAEMFCWESKHDRALKGGSRGCFYSNKPMPEHVLQRAKCQDQKPVSVKHASRSQSSSLSTSAADQFQPSLVNVEEGSTG